MVIIMPDQQIVYLIVTSSFSSIIALINKAFKANCSTLPSCKDDSPCTRASHNLTRHRLNALCVVTLIIYLNLIYYRNQRN